MKTQRKYFQISQLIEVLQKPKNTFQSNQNLQERNNQPISHSRLKQRMSLSPLKIPLEKAISRVVKDRTPRGKTPTPHRNLGVSTRRQNLSNFNNSRKTYYDQPSERQTNIHTETYNFIKKYFNFNDVIIPTDEFIHRILQEYQALWGNNNSQQIIQDFTYKIQQKFGVQNVQLRQLMKLTRNDGMIGLILEIFKEIISQQSTRLSSHESFSQNPSVLSLQKSFQQRLFEDQNIINIKNVIQQFMETMYQCMESQIYKKFNIQMRRMILKYRQTQNTLKKINQKLNMHADIFNLEKKMKEQQKNYLIKIQDLKKSKQKIQLLSERDQQVIQNYKLQKQKMQEQIYKLRQNLQKYQNAILNRALQTTPIYNLDPSLSQKISNSRLSEKVFDVNNSNISQNKFQPLKIQIDTHIVNRSSSPYNQGQINTYKQPSPSKKQNDGFEMNNRNSYGNTNQNRSTYLNISQPKYK